MVVLESTLLLPLESELNAKDSLRSKNQVWLSYSKHQMPGLMIAILVEMCQLQLTQVELEHMKQHTLDLTQV